MVKTPKMRHSRPQREPLTIDLDAESVSRLDDPSESAAASAPEAPLDEAASPFAETQPGFDEADAPKPAGQETSGHAFETAAPPEAVNASEQGGRRAGVPPLLAAGVFGAVAALLLAGALQYAGVLGTPASSSEAVQAQIDALGQRIAAIRPDPAQAGLVGRVDGLASALDAAKSDLAALKQAAGVSGDGGAAPDLQALDARVASLEQAVAKAGQGDGSPAGVGGLPEQIAANESRIAALEQTVAAISAKVDDQASQPKAALAIAAAALKAAIERGGPFVAELDTLAALTPDAPEIAALRPHAEKGVPTHAALAEAAGPAAAAMVAAATPVDDNAGFFARLLDSASSLVTVRPIGAVEGSDAAAIVARMEVAVKGGDFDAAATELDSLPDTVKAAGGSFVEGLKARQAVDRLVAQAVANALKA